MKYSSVYHGESNGESGEFGVKIQLAAGRELTHEEAIEITNLARELGSRYETIIRGNSIANDPEVKREIAEQRTNLLAIFSEHAIYAEEIPNGYSDGYYYKNFPWFIVTTKFGRIKVGWRKRVIVIDWSDSDMLVSAEELFPEESSTKYDKLIHAWGYEDACKYINKLLSHKK